MSGVVLPGGEGETRQRRRIDPSAATAASAPADASGGPTIDPYVSVSLADELVDKLLILDYKTQFCAKFDLKPMSRVFFAMPGKVSEQFPYFSTLVGWLLSLCGSDFMEQTELDALDPNSVCTNLLAELKKLGFQAEFPPAKLRVGWGEAVCRVLEFVADRALARKNFRMAIPIRSESSSMDGGVAGQDVDDIPEDDIDEEVAVAVDEEDDDQPTNDTTGSQHKNDDEAAGPTILESQVDPAVWQLELERVTPLLKVKLASDSKEWRTHLETTSKHGEVIKTLFPETKNALLKLGVELKKLTERVTLKEKAINKDFDNLSSDFRQRQVELDQLSQDYEHLNQSVMEMTNELAIKSDEIENLKNQMADRNQSITDTSPLRQIKQALANLRAEIKQMELRIGVAAQSNLQAKLKEGQRKHTK